MAPFTQRLEWARAVARHPKMRVSNLEAKFGTKYTADTLQRFRRRYPRDRFIWLMGADNLAGLHRWRAWREIFARLPIAIIDRAPYAFSALHNLAALRYRHKRITNSRLLLRGKTLPAWAYISIPRHPQSATALRKSLGAKAFLRHNERT